jgi:Rieske Fe-S protein
VSQQHTTTRGRFLGVATVGLGAAIGGVVAVPTAAYVLAPTTEEATFRPVSLGPAARFKTESGFDPTAVAYIEDRTQPNVSSGLAYVHYTGRGSTEWLSPEAMFVVFSNRCTHVGCPVLGGITGFSCPCHGSQFDREGARIAGPAIRPLDRFQWAVRADGNLWLTQRWSVLISGNRVSYFPVKSPGQPLEGQVPVVSADVLYPAVTYNEPSKPRGS